MTNDLIEKYVEPRTEEGKAIKIQFKQRNSVTGIFIKDRDYNELKSKNFWRIVTSSNFDQYKKSKNSGLAKIFNGAEFTKLSEV